MCHSIPLKTIIFIAAVLYATGCQTQPIAHSEEFTPDDQPKAINRLLDAQAARGAVADGMLYAMHFDGVTLNSLGMAKLDMMLKDDTSLPLAIWLNFPADDKTPARRAAVATYLKDKGLSLEQIQFTDGPNLETGHPAAQGLHDLTKTESDSGASDSSPTAAPPAAGGSH